MTNKQIRDIYNEICERLDFYCAASDNFRSVVLNPEGSRVGFCEVMEELQELNLDIDIELRGGVSKTVIIFDDMSWVIKINHTPRRNDCLREAQFYKAAMDNGLSMFFTPCYFIGAYFGTPLFIQERIDCDYPDDTYTAINKLYEYYINEGKTSEEANEDIDNYEDICDLVRELFTYEWGEDETDRFYHFCEVYGINDIHDGNIGWRNGKVVAVDYSGWGG